MRPGVSAVAVIMCAAVGSAQSSELQSLLDKGAAYVATFKAAFASIVAEEHYVQQFNNPQADSPFGRPLQRDGSGGSFAGAKPSESIRRVLLSDYLLVRTPDGSGWIPFRDVFEVDGRAVRDRQERLTTLFVTPSGDAYEQAGTVVAESARYNVGDVNRNINLPTLGLLFLEPPLQSRFEWKLAGQDLVAEQPTTRVQFTERMRPTLIRGSQGRDLPLGGSAWISADGAVRRTELTAQDQAVSARIVVTYREDAALGVLVPGEMQERYTARRGSGLIEGTATYTNCRRFKVAVTEDVAPPRKPPPL